jgi:hypothetical protein
MPNTSFSPGNETVGKASVNKTSSNDKRFKQLFIKALKAGVQNIESLQRKFTGYYQGIANHHVRNGDQSP